MKHTPEHTLRQRFPLPRLIALACVAFALLAQTVSSPAQQTPAALEGEIKALQLKQEENKLQQQILEMQKKISEQKSKAGGSKALEAKLTELEGQVKAFNQPLSELQYQRPAMQKNIDHVWTLVAGIMVFFMQAGFALLEMGAVRAKNAINCAMKGLLDFCSASICYLLFGFTLMYGPSAGGFIGGHSF